MSARARPAGTVEEGVRGIGRLVAATTIAVPAFFRHRGTQLAAAISYRVLFSLVPFIALALSLLDLVLSARIESEVDEWLAGLAPGHDELEASIARTLANTGTVASITGVVAFVGLLWTASGMAASIRMALDVVWEQPRGRPFVRAKLVDVFVVFIGVALVLAAFVANVTLQLVTTYGVELADSLGLDRVDARIVGSVGQTLVTLGITVAALLIVYRLGANAPPVRELLPGALVGGVAIQLAIIGFSIYVGFVAGFEAIYGALGSVFGFLFLVYLVASCIVVGAEVVAAWAGAGLPRAPEGSPKSVGQQVRDAVRGLFRAPPDAPRERSDADP